MNNLASPEIKEIMDVVNYRPAVSVIMPFDPKMVLKSELAHSLKMAAGKVAKELKANYPNDLAKLVTEKLKHCMQHLNYTTHKKSVAIYVSPVFEKVLYLEIPVEEKIIVDESFEIRDLVYCKKELHKYLLLLLSSNGCKVFLGNTDSFVKIISSSPDAAVTGNNDAPERVANFSDPSERKEKLMDKFLYHIDNTLNHVIKAYPLPVFVMGTEKIAGHFKSITRHTASILEYVHGNYEEATVEELRNVLAPYIADWKKIKQQALLNQLEAAAGKMQLAVGMKEVWKAAANKTGRLLVVEKNFMYAAQHGNSDDVIFKQTAPFNTFSCIKDAVDDVIEKVLENGGDVEFTDEGVLEDYSRIALIQYYKSF